MYLLSFNFTIVTCIDPLLRVKNTGLPSISIINRLICELSLSNCTISLFSLNLISIYGFILLISYDTLARFFFRM